MPRRPSPLAPMLGDTFSTASAYTAGETRRRMRASDLETPFRGVRQRVGRTPNAVDAGPFARDRAQRAFVARRAEAYAEVMPPTAFFAGRTALALRGLPVVHGADLEVAVLSPSRAPRRTGIRGRRIEPALARVETVSGLRVASAASAWAMLADELTVRELIVLGDAIVHVPRDRFGNRCPVLAVATLEHLIRAAAAGRRRGAAKLRAALARIRTESASPPETELRLDAADAGLPTPALDCDIDDRQGRRLGISEFAYPAWMVVVEVEGDHHRADAAQWNRDLEKYAAYADAGWEVVRVSGVHVRRRVAVDQVRRALVRHGWTPASRS